MDHAQQHRFTHRIIKKIAKESGKSINRIKRFIAIEQDQKIMRRFWELVSEKLPEHTYRDIYYCPGCDGFSIE